MKLFYISALSAAILLSGCSKNEELPVTVQQSSNVMHKTNGSKDLKGFLTYYFTTDYDVQCTDCVTGSVSTGNYLGSGALTHLGKVSSGTRACYTYIFSGSQVVGLHIENQCASFKAPNGDLLYLSNDPYDLYFNQNGTATGTCRFYFDGGTGKYEHAAGSFTGAVVNNLQGKFTVDLKGKISY